MDVEIKKNRDANVLFISQTDYIQKVLKKFNMHVAKPVMIPMAQHLKLSAKDSPETIKVHGEGSFLLVVYGV